MRDDSEGVPPMRIGVLSQWYDPEPGGAAIPGALARELARRGHDVVSLTGFPNYPTGRVYDGYHMRPRTSREEEGVRVTRVALYPNHGSSSVGRIVNYGSFAASSATLGLSSLRGLDALWVYNSPGTIALPMWAARYMLGVPHVLHVMDLWPDSILETAFGSGSAGRGIAQKALVHWCAGMYRSASSIAYITPGVGQALRNRGVPSNKLFYVPVWADAVATRPAEPTERSRWGVRDCDVLVLYAGTMGDAQGLDVLIEGLARLSPGTRIHCLLAGSGTAEARLKAQARAAGLTNVTFLGQLPRAEMPGLMSAADLHVVMLKDRPIARITTPSKIQTTLASAKPFLASVAGDTATVAIESGAGLLAEPGQPDSVANALTRAAAMGRENLAAHGRNGHAYYERHYSLESGVSSIEKMLWAAAASRGRGHVPVVARDRHARGDRG